MKLNWNNQQYRILILTDHTNHSKENSVYAILKSLTKHDLVNQVDIATRGLQENDSFFYQLKTRSIWATAVKEDFSFSENGAFYKQNIRQVLLSDYDLIWLRMPPPLEQSFLDFLTLSFPKQFIINKPLGIYETGSKAFLMNFKEICAPMKICNSIEDIIEFKNQFPIVLKPFREYGGKGIVRIEGDKVWDKNKLINFDVFKASLNQQKVAYLAVKFLKNVSKGDKRIIVVNGEILGASLRMPSEGSWMCNVAMGGTSVLAEIEAEEYEIVETLQPVLSKMGIVMYGVDTLVGDDGKRVLSEINTTSIGGIAQIAAQRNLPLVEKAVELTLDYFLKNKNNG